MYVDPGLLVNIQFDRFLIKSMANLMEGFLGVSNGCGAADELPSTSAICSFLLFCSDFSDELQ